MALRDYQTVDERLREWWGNHPNGRIITRIVESHGEQRWTVMAEAYRDHDDERPVATGMAYGDPSGSSGAQATNPLEDAETSAIGRALANAGYSPKGARPSAEEVRQANARNSKAPDPRTTIRERIKAANLVDAFVGYLAATYDTNRLDDLSDGQVAGLLALTSSQDGLASIEDFAPVETGGEG